MATPFVIPKFREKIIYWTTNAGTGVSYPVSASYKGILRLSPNDDLTLQEQEPIKLYDDGIENYYRDCIEPAIGQQFIRISSSDGYFVGLRLTQNELEGDNVYVIGPSKFNMVRLYAKKNKAFHLKKNTALPARVNLNTPALITSNGNIDKDISGVDTSNPVDQSDILTSRSLDEREFTYEQTTQLIRQLVIEALMDLATIPTGSIHYTPISITEYVKLLKEGCPNAYYKTDSEEPNDPIIRDYLVCDGCLYKNEQFPELAKILEGERIDYWRFDSTTQRMVQTTYINDYSDHKWFRVPDLRTRFIKSVMLDRASAELANNVTGMYSNDARPIKANATLDNHTHFITTGFYQPDPQMQYFDTVATITKETGKRDKWKLTDNPGVLHPHNKDMHWGHGKYGAWYNVHRYNGGCIPQAVDTNYAQFFLSIPQEYDYQNPNCVPNVGLSSDDMYSCKEKPSNDGEISYNERTDYNKYATDTAAVESYGMENAPEFCCMLPLIKI